MRSRFLTVIVTVIAFLFATVMVVTQPTTIPPTTPSIFSQSPWWTFSCPTGWLPKANFQTTYLTCVNQALLHTTTSTNTSPEGVFDANLTGTSLVIQPPLPTTLFISPPLVLSNAATGCGTFHISNFTMNSFSLNYTLPAPVKISYHIDYVTTHYVFPNDTEYIQELSQCSLAVDSVLKA